MVKRVEWLLDRRFLALGMICGSRRNKKGKFVIAKNLVVRESYSSLA